MTDLYWIDDYDSGEDVLYELKQDAIKRCEEILKTESRVRVGKVMLYEMQLQASKSDLVDVVCALEETGKYRSRAIKFKDSTDFIISRIPKKSLIERYWVVTEVVKYSIGFVLGFLAKKYL